MGKIQESSMYSLYQELKMNDINAKLVSLFTYRYDKDYDTLVVIVDADKILNKKTLIKLLEIAALHSCYVELDFSKKKKLDYTIKLPWEHAEFIEQDKIKYNRKLGRNQKVFTYADWVEYCTDNTEEKESLPK